jgi:GxxExxY protein
MYTGEDLAKDMLTQRVIGAAIEVHRKLGPGLLESIYQECLVHELKLRGIDHAQQVWLPIAYKDHAIPQGLRLDLLIERQLIVELKAAESILKIHEVQLLSYLRLSGLQRGLLLNFNVVVLKNGIKRIMNNYEPQETLEEEG